MEWNINTTPNPLYPQDKHTLPLYRRLGGTQGPSERVSRRDNTLFPPEFKPQPRHYAHYVFSAPASRYEHFIFVHYLLKFCGEGVLLTDALTFLEDWPPLSHPQSARPCRPRREASEDHGTSYHVFTRLFVLEQSSSDV